MVVVAAVQLHARDVQDANQALQAARSAVVEAAGRGAELVVLPECTWPGYFLGSRWRGAPWVERAEQVVEELSAAARAAGVVLVAGLAMPAGQQILNAAIVWDSDGRIAGTAAKRFLWDFDRAWFTPGQGSTVIDTSVGRLGVFICADGRLPEIARSLALAGAEVLVDPTAWVTSGADPSSWTNPQYEFLLRTRARENGLWAVAANKVGVEAEAIAYCGRSCIIDPDGAVVAAAEPDGPEVVVAECAVAPARLPVSRRPKLYATLARPTDDLPIASIVDTPATASASAVRVCLTAGTEPAVESARAVDLGSDLVLTTGELDPVHLDGFVLVAPSADEATLYELGVPVASWGRTHGPNPPADETGGVHDLGPLKLGVLLGDEARVPEMPRRLMLEGADLLVWVPAPGSDPAAQREDAATRALENRVYVAVAPPPGGEGCPMVIAPSGDVIIEAGPRRTVVADITTAQSRLKQMAPGTDVVLDRQPGSYGFLVGDALDAMADSSAQI